MTKDTTYTLRTDGRIKEALAIAAKKDRRTVASLLEKIIVDYLEREGIEWETQEHPVKSLVDKYKKKSKPRAK